jgi:predicted ATP-grasp superfamily ATP-dependent carboligase
LPNGQPASLSTATRNRAHGYVTNAELPSALSVIRSLGRQGWKAVAASDDPSAPGLSSRYVSAALLHEPTRATPDLVYRRLHDAVVGHAVDLLIPVTDDALLAVIPHRSELPATCAVAAAPDVSLRLAMDKAATLEVSRQQHVPVPDGELITSENDIRRYTGHLGWPIVVKPAFSRVRRPDGGIQALTTGYAHARTTSTNCKARLPR